MSIDYYESKRLREDRAGVVKQMHELSVGVAKEQRSMSGEEKIKWDKLENDEKSLKEKIDSAERYERSQDLYAEMQGQSKPEQRQYNQPLAKTEQRADDQINSLRAWALAGRAIAPS